MGRRSKGLVAIACAVALVGAIVLLALLRTDDGREIAGEAKSTGWRWVDEVANTTRSWFDHAVGARHSSLGATCQCLDYRISERRFSRWSSRKVSASAEARGGHQIHRLELMTGVDRNGDGRVDHDEWTRIAVVECTEGTPPTRFVTPETEVAEDVGACWIRIEGEPIATFGRSGTFDAIVYDDGLGVEMK
jgi:hypothetical protein